MRNFLTQLASDLLRQIEQVLRLIGITLKWLIKNQIYLIKYALFANVRFIGGKNGKEIGKTLSTAQSAVLLSAAQI